MALSTTVPSRSSRGKSEPWWRRRAAHAGTGQPIADTQVIGAVEAEPAADSDSGPGPEHCLDPEPTIAPVMHHTTDPIPVAHNMLAVLADGLRHNWSATRYADALRVHVGEMNKRAGFELLTAQTKDRRGERNEQGAEAMGRGLAGAIEAGLLDPKNEAAAAEAVERMAHTIAARASHASDPTQETGLLPAIREDASAPAELSVKEQAPDHVTFAVTAPVSPVHRDGMAPPVPDPDPADVPLSDADATRVIEQIARGGSAGAR